MSKMPERIWGYRNDAGLLRAMSQPMEETDVEYVRADIHEAEVERLNNKLVAALICRPWMSEDEARAEVARPRFPDTVGAMPEVEELEGTP